MSKETIRQIGIGVVIWIVGSALWGLLSSSLHIPQFDWNYIGSTILLFFSVLFFGVILPFIQQTMRLYFRRKQFEQDKVEYAWRESIASKGIMNHQNLVTTNKDQPS